MATLKLSTAQYRRLGKPEETHTERNTRNQAHGKRFEDWLIDYHAELEARHLARVMRTNPKIRVTGPGRAVIIGKGEVDFVAFLANGKVVHFDAKSRQKDAFSLEDEHQVDWLRNQAAYGHTAGYLVYWSDHDQVRWHPIETIEKRVRLKEGSPVNDVAWLDLFLSH